MTRFMFSMAALVILTSQTSYARHGGSCCCGGAAGPANMAAAPAATVPMGTAPMAAVPRGTVPRGTVSTYRTAQIDSGPIVGRTAYQPVGRAYGYTSYAAPYFGAGFRDEVNTHNYPDFPSRYSFGRRPASAKANSNYAH